MNVPRMFTAFNQSCPVHFMLSYLLLCKIIHIFNFIFSFNFFINQVIKIFATPSFFTSEIQSNFKRVLFRSSFSCIFITENLALFPGFSANINHFILTIFKLIFIFYFFYFLFFIFFKSLILHCSIS